MHLRYIWVDKEPSMRGGYMTQHARYFIETRAVVDR